MMNVFCLAVMLALPLQNAPAAAAPVERVWYDGDRPVRIWMAPDQVAVVYEPATAARSMRTAEQSVRSTEPAAVLIHRNGPVAYFRINDGQHTRTDHVRALKNEPGVRHTGPAFYESPTMRNTEAMALSGEIIVGFDGPADAKAFADAHGIAVVQAIAAVPNTYLFDARAVPDSLSLANNLRREPGVKFAYPNWYRHVAPR
jgi:hypothetical protein